jgi:hypothetical protein
MRQRTLALLRLDEVSRIRAGGREGGVELGDGGRGDVEAFVEGDQGEKRDGGFGFGGGELEVLNRRVAGVLDLLKAEFVEWNEGGICTRGSVSKERRRDRKEERETYRCKSG